MFDYGKVQIGGPQTVVIAEAGVNHLKDYNLAEQHIRALQVLEHKL